MNYHDQDGTPSDMICAPATPEGSSALAVIRISGQGCAGLVERTMELEQGRLKGTRRKTGLIKKDGKILDQVVVLGWPEGSSYTGEEMVEIICHGVPATVRDILDCLMEGGARAAEPGEFTRRAYAKGRLSAWQVISLASLWSGIEGRRELCGSGEDECGRILRSIVRAREKLEGEIEFGEEHEIDHDSSMSMTMEELGGMLKEFGLRVLSMEGELTALIMGPVNSGKSTLFNLLAGADRAIVSEEPGTTRDGASCTVEIKGRRVHLSDTAGAGGIGLDRKAFESVIGAMTGMERVVWMSADGEEPPPELKDRTGEIIMVRSKSDLSPYEAAEGTIRVSSISGEGVETLEEMLSSVPGSVSLSGAVKRMESEIALAEENIADGDYSIAAEHLIEVEREVRGLMGRGDSVSLSVERALSSMCVGK